MKFLPHDLRQIKYKISWLYSNFFFVVVVFLDERNKNNNFEWFLAENGHGPLGVKKT